MQEERPLDQSLSVFKGIPGIASLPFKGQFCLETDVSTKSLESNYHNLFEFTLPMYRGCKHIFGSAQMSTPLLVDWKGFWGGRLVTDLLQAAKSVGNCSLVSNGRRGLRAPSNVTDVQDDRRAWKCSNFRKYSLSSFGEEEIAPSQNEGTGSNPPYRVTTYTGDKKNARGSNSSGLSLK